MNTPSNYPPGVNGTEEAITGCPEWEAGWEAGCEATLRHQACCANPYPPGSSAWYGWNDGHRDGYRETLGNMEPAAYQELRAAYYKAAEGIAALKALMASADCAPFHALRANTAKLAAAMGDLDPLGRYL